MKTSIIRPGILVALRTTVSGGVHYERVDIEDKRNVKRWETTRIMSDPTEHERAVKVRSKARTLIVRVCAQTNFGLLCRAEQEDELADAIEEARRLVDEFNATACYTSIRISVLKGRVAETDTEAVRAIVGEISSLIDRMREGIEKADVATIRDAANRARATASMLDDSQQSKIENAIAAARKAAREIVKRVEKGGEKIVKVVEQLDTGAITAARMSFLDLDSKAADAQRAPSIEKQRFADLGFDEDEEEEAESHAM